MYGNYGDQLSECMSKVECAGAVNKCRVLANPSTRKLTLAQSENIIEIEYTLTVLELCCCDSEMCEQAPSMSHSVARKCWFDASKGRSVSGTCTNQDQYCMTVSYIFATSLGTYFIIIIRQNVSK